MGIVEIDDWFDRFFEEKKISNQIWSFKDAQGKLHTFDSRSLITWIKDASEYKKAFIREVLMGLDLAHCDINAYLRLLSKDFVEKSGEQEGDADREK